MSSNLSLLQSSRDATKWWCDLSYYTAWWWNLCMARW